MAEQNFCEFDAQRTLQWLREERFQDLANAIEGGDERESFAGMPDFMPVLGDEGLENMREIIEELLKKRSSFANPKIPARTVARVKQAMRKKAGIGKDAAPTAKQDVEEAEGKLQGVKPLTGGSNVDALARTVSEKMSFSSNSSDAEGPAFIKKLFKALNDDTKPLKYNVKYKRQLKLVGPSNNGKTELAQWMARMWVASADDPANGRWIEEYVTSETMDAHLWSARESTGSAPREIWGSLRYLFDLALNKDNKNARFALVINEANRGNLFNALNRIWWEKRRNYPSKAGVPKGEQLPPNLALIFTENPATADYATIGDGDDALYTRLPPECTFALVRSGTDKDELEELGVPNERRFSTENVGLIYALKSAAANGDIDLNGTLLRLASSGDDSAGDITTFQDKFKVSVSDFRKNVAGKQIDIVDDLLPPPAPEAMDILDTRPQEVKQYLDANPNASLLFADETSNSQEAFSPFYTWLRNRLSAKQHRATMAEIITLTTGSDLEKSMYLYPSEKSPTHGIKLRIASWVAPCREKPSGKIQEPGCIRIVDRVAFDEWLKAPEQRPQSPLGKRSQSPSTTTERGRLSAKKIRGSHGDATSPVAEEDEEDDGPPQASTHLRHHPSTELAFVAEKSTQSNRSHVTYYAYLREKIQRREYVLGRLAPVASVTDIIRLTNQWEHKDSIRRQCEADKDFNKYVIPAVVAGWMTPKQPLVKIRVGNEFCTWEEFCEANQ